MAWIIPTCASAGGGAITRVETRTPATVTATIRRRVFAASISHIKTKAKRAKLRECILMTSQSFYFRQLPVLPNAPTVWLPKLLLRLTTPLEEEHFLPSLADISLRVICIVRAK